VAANELYAGPLAAGQPAGVAAWGGRLVGERGERNDIGAGLSPALQQVGVDETESGVRGEGDALAGGRQSEAGGLGCLDWGGLGQDGVQVEGLFGEVGQAVEQGGQVVAFAGLNQAEMAFGQSDGGVPGDTAEDGHAELGHGGLDAVGVAGAAEAVEDHAGDAHGGIVGGEAAGDGGGGLGLAGDVQHQDDGQVIASGEVGGATAAAGGAGHAVEQAHGGFDDEDVRRGTGVPEYAVQQGGRHGPAVEIDAGGGGGGGVEGGVDIVRAALAGAHRKAAAAQGGEHGEGDGGFAAAGAGRADDQAAGHAGVS
jgi:hypothetical protein